MQRGCLVSWCAHPDVEPSSVARTMALLWIGSTTAFGTALRKNRAEPAGLFRDDRYDRKMPNYPVEWESIRQEAAPVRGLACVWSEGENLWTGQ